MLDSMAPGARPVDPDAQSPERALLEVAALVDQDVREAMATWRTSVVEAVLSPLGHAAGRAAQRHAELIEAEPPNTCTARARHIVQYREAAEAHVLCPLSSALERLYPSDAWEGGSALLGSLEEAAARFELPTVVPLSPAPPSDSAGLRGRLSHWLVIWRLRLASRSSTSESEPVRRVPVQQLLQYHTQVRIARRVQERQEVWQQHVASLVGRLERALVQWTHDLLGLEQAAEEGVTAPVSDARPKESHLPDALIPVQCALHEALDSIARELELPDNDADRALAHCHAQLLQDLAAAGTPLLTRWERRRPRQHPHAAIKASRDRWADWHAQAAQRLDTCAHFVGLRSALLDAQTAVSQSAQDQALAPLRQQFTEAATRLHNIVDSVADDSAETLAAKLEEVLVVELEPVRRHLTKPGDFDSLVERLHRPGELAWSVLHGAIEQWPESVALHRLPATGAPIRHEPRLLRRQYRRDLARVLSQSPDRLAKHLYPFLRRCGSTWVEGEEVLHEIEFSLEIALKELRAATSLESTDQALYLLNSGLNRAEYNLRNQLQSVEQAWEDFGRLAASVFRQDWNSVQRILQSKGVFDYRWHTLSTSLVRAQRAARHRLEHGVLRSQQVAGHLTVSGQRRASTLIAQGRAVIGTGTALPGEWGNALSSISPRAIAELFQGLPLVYQRIFDLEATCEPWLFAGRSVDLLHLKGHVAKWWGQRSGDVLVLPMPPGSGRTSLLRALASNLDSPVSVCAITDRPLDTDAVTSSLASALEFEGETLEELEQICRKAPQRVCLVDNFEHLVLRCFGGSEIAKRLLQFFVRTSANVCWIVTVNDLAWQYLDRTSSSTTGLVSTYRPQLTRRSLSDILLSLNKRSGFNAQFLRPRTTPARLLRKLSRARSEESKQAALRDYYFDQLFAHCGSALTMALTSWLRAAQFDERTVTLSTDRAFEFKFLKRLDPVHCFSLKAFLMHNTLTPDEHRRVFSSLPDGGMSVLQALSSLGVIIPSGYRLAELDGASGALAEGTRYRLHPLLLYPVTRELRARNIVH